jgi:hypothetical protein
MELQIEASEVMAGFRVMPSVCPSGEGWTEVDLTTWTPVFDDMIGDEGVGW